MFCLLAEINILLLLLPGDSRTKEDLGLRAFKIFALQLQHGNKKLRYREEHSATVVLSWCTL